MCKLAYPPWVVKDNVQLCVFLFLSLDSCLGHACHTVTRVTVTAVWAFVFFAFRSLMLLFWMIRNVVIVFVSLRAWAYRGLLGVCQKPDHNWDYMDNNARNADTSPPTCAVTTSLLFSGAVPSRNFESMSLCFRVQRRQLVAMTTRLFFALATPRYIKSSPLCCLALQSPFSPSP